MNTKNISDLIEWVNHGNPVKYLYFWGHRKSENNITKSCFSQWYESEFNGGEPKGKNSYKTAEHFMMAEKARLFNNDDLAIKIMKSENPGEAKKLGRMVEGFNEGVWLEHRFDIVVRANMLKFGQNSDLKAFLLNSGDRVLVEASPVDSIWGVGLAADDPNIANPNCWKGLNLLGFALMEVRERLME